MPPVENNTPKNLKPFIFHGIDLSYQVGENARGECPFCGKPGKFHVDPETSKWDCKTCGANGNGISFIRQLWDASDKATTEYDSLAAQKKLLYPETLMHWGAVKSIITGDWMLPAFSHDGKMNNLYRYIKQLNSDKWLLVPTPTFNHHSFGVKFFDPKKKELYICYADDTEVLTSTGWRPFKELSGQEDLAAYESGTQRIHYEKPKALQSFKYNGEMLNFRGRWLDLLVTPDHRMLVKRTQMKRGQVRKAREVGAQFQLPVSGIRPTAWADQSHPTMGEVRLLVAFVADGCIRRGDDLELRFKKARKKERIRLLAEDIGAVFKTLQYPGSPEYDSVMIDRTAHTFFLKHCPNKTWTEEILDWPLDVRQALLEEIPNWDGDRTSHNLRYFTSKLEEAELISRLAILSGYSSQVETKTGRKGSTEYVVNFIKRDWRILVEAPVLQQYEGQVYCATVSTGFLVVRRNGKAVISGNCEGPWDGMALWETMRASKVTENGLTLTGNEAASLYAGANILSVPGANAFPESVLPLVGDKTVYLLFDNDHAKEVNGRKIDGAGIAGMRRAANAMAKAEKHPTQLEYLHWGKDGFDPELPTGTDVRDLLARGQTIVERVPQLEALLGRIQPIPPTWITGRSAKSGKGSVEIEPVECKTWNECLAQWKKSMMKMTEGLERALSGMLACAASTEIPGDDQLWLKIIGPPSSGKTTLCEALSISKKYVFANSTFTGFHSGFKSDKEGTEDHSFIKFIRGKTLITKDGDSLLKNPQRDKILADGRDVYDKVARVFYNNGIGIRDQNDIYMTWILCGTESLRELDTSELGERYIDIVTCQDMDEELEDEIGWRVANKANRQMEATNGSVETDTPERILAKQMTSGYLEYLRKDMPELLSMVNFPSEKLKECQRLALFVAHMRARPSKKQEEKAQRELSFRLISQFVRLAKCLAVVLNHKEVNDDVMRRVRLCALDTARGVTLSIAKRLREVHVTGGAIASLAIIVNQSDDRIRNLLRFLRNIGVVEPFQKVSGGIVQSGVRWRLTKRMLDIYESVVLNKEPANASAS